MEGFKLRFAAKAIPQWAERYSYAGKDRILAMVGPVQKRGYLTKEEFLAVCAWKTKRSRSRCAANAADRVQTAVRLALSMEDSRIKMGILRVLDGVDWPTASVILHFFDRLPYPILDYRALWSLGLERVPVYSFALWEEYTTSVRGLCRRTGYSIRIIDRALWQYSKEKE